MPETQHSASTVSRRLVGTSDYAQIHRLASSTDSVRFSSGEGYEILDMQFYVRVKW